MKAILGGVLAASLWVSPAFAQSSSGTWNGLSDRFQIDTGYFRLSADTVLRYNGEQGSGDINFEEDLGLNPNVNKYNKYTYDRAILVNQLGGAITYEGFQVFLSFLF